MFTKLLKYDLRATSGVCGILSAAVLALATLAAVLVNILLKTAEYTANQEFSTFCRIFVVLILIFVGFSMVGYMVAVEILQLVRFYKSRFTDQGYLTFTLPVKPRHIFASGFWSVVIWMVLSGLVFLVCAGILIFGILGWKATWEDIGDFFTWTDVDLAYVISYFAQYLVAVVYGIVIALTSLTLGAVIAKKHKLLLAFGFLYGINTLSGTVTAILNIGLRLIWIFRSNFQIELLVFWINTFCYLLLLVIGWLLSVRLMKRKLNLP